MAKKAFIEKAQAEKAPAEYVMDTLQPAKDLPAEGHETKSRKVSFIVRPSVYEDAKIIAFCRKQSLNSIINDAIESYVEANRDQLEAYREAMKTIQI